MSTLVAFLPDEALLPLVVLSGILLMLGMARRSYALLAAALAAPFGAVVAEALLAALPTPWILLVLVVATALAARSLLVLLIGRRGADKVVGELAADLILGVVRLPFRLVGWLLRVLFRSRPR